MFNSKKRRSVPGAMSNAELQRMANESYEAAEEMRRRTAAREKQSVGLSESGNKFYITVNGAKFGPFTIHELDAISKVTTHRIAQCFGVSWK